MKTLSLKRIAETEDGTFGALLDGDVPFAVTLEPQWKDNATGISSIPEGEYKCRRVLSPKFGDTFEVPVPGRSHILFHKGNVDDDTQGCILVGEQFTTWTDGTAAIGGSGVAFKEFMDRLKGEDAFWLFVN